MFSNKKGKNRKFKSLLILFFSFFLFVSAFSQPFILRVDLDTTHILIGDYLHADITIKAPKNAQFIVPKILQKEITPIEIVNISALDTTKSETELILHQKYTITAFDTGSYFFPSLYILDIDSSILAHSDSLFFSVSTIEVDTTAAIKDIKLPTKVPLTFGEIVPYILIFIGIVIIVLLIIWLFIKYAPKNKKTTTPIKIVPKEKAHIIALRNLDKLWNKKLWQENKIKQYYSELTDIIRIYIKNRWEIDAMEMTTNEIMNEIEKIELEKSKQEELLSLLTIADLVKFAKSQPLPDEHENCYQQAKLFVEKTAEIVVNSEIK